MEQSHLVSSHKTNEFKYLIDTDESSSEYNITVNGIAAFNQSPHQNKKAYDITLIKDSGSNDYRSRIGFNIYTLAIGTYTIVFEFYPPEMTNIQLSCTASEAYIHKAVQRDFTAYSKLLVQFNNNSKRTPNYIYLTMHGTATATPVQCDLVVYGVKDWSDSVYPGVYDGLDNVMFEYKNGDMQMEVNLDMNNKIISGLINPIYDSEAMNLGYFTNLFKTKYTGTIASGVFHNFSIPVSGNIYFNLYSVILVSNIQVSNAQILIRGKLQGQTSNTDTYYRIGNIINGSNTFNMPKSRKFVSIDSMSILDNIGAGTSVNGSFELKVLHSDHFERYHQQNTLSKDSTNNWNAGNLRIKNVSDPVDDHDVPNLQWMRRNYNLIYTGDILGNTFKNSIGQNLELSNVMILSVYFTSNRAIDNANVVFVNDDGSRRQATLNIIKGLNILNLNYRITKRFRIILVGRRPGHHSPVIINGKYKLELSTLFI